MRISGFLVALGLVSGLWGCREEKAALVAPAASCFEGGQRATVAHGPNRCDANGWVVRLDSGGTYPTDALPAGFQQDGLRVCVAYALYQDLGACPCCGGTRLRVQQIQLP